MTLDELVKEAHAASRSKGWYDPPNDVRNIPELLALIHSEVSEALEAYRTDFLLKPNDCAWHEVGAEPQHGKKPDGFGIEIADIVIRIGDLCGYLGIDLDHAVRRKMAYNETRQYRHGGKVA